MDVEARGLMVPETESALGLPADDLERPDFERSTARRKKPFLLVGVVGPSCAERLVVDDVAGSISSSISIGSAFLM